MSSGEQMVIPNGEGVLNYPTGPTRTVVSPAGLEQATSRRDGVLQLLNDSINDNTVSIQDLIDLTLVHVPKKEKVKKTENKRAYHKEWYTRNKQEVLKKIKLNKQLKKCRGVLSQPNPTLNHQDQYESVESQRTVEGQMKP